MTAPDSGAVFFCKNLFSRAQKECKINGKGGRMNFGYFLICLGIMFLLENFGVIHGGMWNLIIALFLLFMGATMIKKSMAKKDSDGG